MLQTDVINVYSNLRSVGDADGRTAIGEFAVHNDALTAAAETVMNNLFDLHRASGYTYSATELYEHWLTEGIEAHIEPDDAQMPFSAMNFARLIVLQVTGDYKYTLILEVTCQDALIFPSGFAAPSREWKFWVKAPGTYHGPGVDGLVRRATEVLYEDMSYKALEADGSRYKLLELWVHEVTESQMRSEMNRTNYDTVYFVQKDGAFGTTLPRDD